MSAEENKKGNNDRFRSVRSFTLRNDLIQFLDDKIQKGKRSAFVEDLLIKELNFKPSKNEGAE